MDAKEVLLRAFELLQGLAVLVGGDGADNINGGEDNDTVIGGAGADSLDGGAGDDTADYSASAAIVVDILNNLNNAGGDALGDTFVNIETIVGSAFDDDITGDNKNNILVGGDGDDTLDGGVSDDTLIGGNGTDTVDYSASSFFVAVSLVSGNGGAGDATGDVLVGIENIIIFLIQCLGDISECRIPQDPER